VTKQLIAILIAVGVGGVAHAQEKASPPADAKPTATPLKVQVTISRYQGDKKLSSMPYTLFGEYEHHRT
jgi:hypothetical protein